MLLGKADVQERDGVLTIVLPENLSESLNLKKGDVLLFKSENGKIFVEVKRTSKKELIVKAFTGESEPVAVSIRVNGRSKKIVFDYGEIKLPRFAVSCSDFKELEKKFSCVIREDDEWVSIIPNFILGFNNMFNSGSSSLHRLHRNLLKKWLKNSGATLIKTLV